MNKNGLWKWLLHNPAAIFISASCIVVLRNGKILPFFSVEILFKNSSDCCVVPSFWKSQIFANLLDFSVLLYFKNVIICVNIKAENQFYKRLSVKLIRVVHKIENRFLQIFVFGAFVLPCSHFIIFLNRKSKVLFLKWNT